jgi:hypothetical protein
MRPRVLIVTDSHKARSITFRRPRHPRTLLVESYADQSPDLRARLKPALAGRLNAAANTIIRGPLRIDVKLRRVFVFDEPLSLIRRHFNLLLLLSRSKAGVPASILCALLLGSKKRGRQLLAEAVRRLRSNLKRVCGQDMITATPGGYKLAYSEARHHPDSLATRRFPSAIRTTQGYRLRIEIRQ